MLMSGYEFWALKATNGVPLDLLVEELINHGIYPKWDEVLLAAKKDGTNIKKLVASLKTYFEVVTNPDTRQYLIIGIEALYEKMVEDQRL